MEPACIGNPRMSTPCWSCAMRSIMSEGLRRGRPVSASGSAAVSSCERSAPRRAVNRRWLVSSSCCCGLDHPLHVLPLIPSLLRCSNRLRLRWQLLQGLTVLLPIIPGGDLWLSDLKRPSMQKNEPHPQLSRTASLCASGKTTAQRLASLPASVPLSLHSTIAKIP
jgi:hypothetical protein